MAAMCAVMRVTWRYIMSSSVPCSAEQQAGRIVAHLGRSEALSVRPQVITNSS